MFSITHNGATSVPRCGTTREDAQGSDEASRRSPGMRWGRGSRQLFPRALAIPPPADPHGLAHRGQSGPVPTGPADDREAEDIPGCGRDALSRPSDPPSRKPVRAGKVHLRQGPRIQLHCVRRAPLSPCRLGHGDRRGCTGVGELDGAGRKMQLPPLFARRWELSRGYCRAARAGQEEGCLCGRHRLATAISETSLRLRQARPCREVRARERGEHRARTSLRLAAKCFPGQN